MDYLQQFCAEPSGPRFRQLSNQIQTLLYEGAIYCLGKKKGNTALAHRIKLYYVTRNLSDQSRQQLVVLFKCMALLQTPSFVSAVKLNFPVAKIILQQKGTNVEISYNTELPNMFIIRQSGDILGVDKELALYPDDAKEHLTDLFVDQNLDLHSILIYLRPGFVQTFYHHEYGLTWGNDDCLACLQKQKRGEKLDKNCTKLVRQNCQKSFGPS